MWNSADCVVVGGGVMGTSIAFHLAQRAAGSVILCEQSFLGAGSSGKSGAIVRQYYTNRLTVAMARHGLRFYERFPEIVGGPDVFTRSGMVLIASGESRAAVDGCLAMQRACGVATGVVSADELQAIDPQARLHDDEFAAFETEAGYCEALQVVSSLADASRRQGVEIRIPARVHEIVCSKGQVSAVVTSAGKIATRCVVLATGSWAARLSGQLGFELPVQPSRAQVALVRRPTDFGPPGPVYGDFAQQIYFKPTHGEMLHVGNVDPREERAPVDPEALAEVADEPFVREMRGKLARRYASLDRGVGRGGFSALYEVTPDWHPVIDRLPGVEGVYCAAGFSGHGFKMAPTVGLIVSELIVDGSSHTFDVSPLRATRFQEDRRFGATGSATVMG